MMKICDVKTMTVSTYGTGALNKYLKDNNICVPRIHEIFMMDGTKPIECLHNWEQYAAHMCVFAYGEHWNTLCKYCCEGNVIRWDRIRGKKRRNLKYVLKKLKKNMLAQQETWNKYAGRDDVLFVSARVGSLNWFGYGCYKLENHPLFLDKVDDWFDSTFCDIYFRVPN